MPRYELMYILASSVSDDIVESTSKEIEQFVSDFGGTQIEHEMLGKKKLAYAIKKTRNGHYGLITFSMEGKSIAKLEAKLRTQRNTIIRFIIVNIDEHLERLEKDKLAQAKMNQNRDTEKAKAAEEADADNNTKPDSVESKPSASKKKVTSEQIDDQIEKALTEDLSN
ncbi:MAG: 30S ribosomal protein S6 [Candidatus Doudnabacteria bacterium]